MSFRTVRIGRSVTADASAGEYVAEDLIDLLYPKEGRICQRGGTTSAGPLAAVGIATFDGKGAVSTARQTIRRIGVTTSDLFTTPAGVGPYQVDPDCGLRLLNPDGSVLGHGVVVSGGKELFILSLSDANSVYGVMRKISTED